MSLIFALKNFSLFPFLLSSSPCPLSPFPYFFPHFCLSSPHFCSSAHCSTSSWFHFYTFTLMQSLQCCSVSSRASILTFYLAFISFSSVLTFQWSSCASDLISASYYWCLSFAVLMPCLISWLHGESSSAWVFAFFCWWYFVKCCSVIFWMVLTLMIFWVYPSPWHSCFYQESSVSFSPDFFT